MKYSFSNGQTTRIYASKGMSYTGVQVFKASLADGSTVAIKTLSNLSLFYSESTPEHDERNQNAFDNEVALLSAFDHPHIIKLRQDVEVEDIPETVTKHFVVEYFGEDLSDYHNRYNLNVPLHTYMDHAVQTAQALHYLHSLEIPVVHADLKPENVMLSNGVCKLIDFGNSKRVPKEGRPWQDGDAWGTPPYLGPETRKENNLVVGTALDVIAFAYVFLSLREGDANDFSYSELNHILLKRLVEHSRPNLMRASNTPEEIKPLFTRMWALKPQDRPTMEAVLPELEAIRDKYSQAQKRL